MDDEGVDRQALVAVEGDAGVGLIWAHPQLFQELLGWVRGVALRGTGWEGHLPSELDDGGEEPADEADDDRGPDASPGGIGLLQQGGQHECLQMLGGQAVR